MKTKFKIAFLPKDAFKEKMPDSHFIQFPDNKNIATIITDNEDVDEIKGATVFDVRVNKGELSEYVLTRNSVSCPYTFMKQFGENVFSSVGLFCVKVETTESLAYIKAINENMEMSQFEMKKKDSVRLFCIQSQEILQELTENSIIYTHLYDSVYLVKDEDAVELLDELNNQGTTEITVSPFVTKPQKYIMKMKVDSQGLSDEIKEASAHLIDTKYLIFDDFECDSAKDVSNMICETNSFSLDMNIDNIIKIAEIETGKVIWFFSQDDVLSIIFKTTTARDACVNKYPKLFMPNGTIISTVPKKPTIKPTSNMKNIYGVDLTPKDGIDYWLVYGIESELEAKRLSQVLDQCSGCQTSTELNNLGNDGKIFAVLEFPAIYNAIKSFHLASIPSKFPTTKIKEGKIKTAINKILSNSAKFSPASSEN